MVGKYVDLAELPPFMDFFFQRFLYTIPWANYETDFFPPRTDDYLEARTLM